jgi:formate hydrogenlyase subunit 4
MLAVENSGLWKKASASGVLIVISWFIVLIAENSRVPVDDPNTHLELTMIHEVMVLDHGGPAFGLIQYGASLKLTIFCALLASLILPLASQQPLLHSLLIVAGILSIGIIIGLVESVMARLRLVRIPQLLITSMLLAAFAVVLLLR